MGKRSPASLIENSREAEPGCCQGTRTLPSSSTAGSEPSQLLAFPAPWLFHREDGRETTKVTGVLQGRMPWHVVCSIDIDSVAHKGKCELPLPKITNDFHDFSFKNTGHLLTHLILTQPIFRWWKWDSERSTDLSKSHPSRNKGQSWDPEPFLPPPTPGPSPGGHRDTDGRCWSGGKTWKVETLSAEVHLAIYNKLLEWHIESIQMLTSNLLHFFFLSWIYSSILN